MSELEKIIYTACTTIAGGILVYLIGQLISKTLIDPATELRKTIGSISQALWEHAPIYSNAGLIAGEDLKKTSDELRRLSAQLESHLYLIPRYCLTAGLFSLPTRKQLMTAVTHLRGLSASVDTSNYENKTKRIEHICDSLGIYLPEDRRWPKDAPLPPKVS